jgi:LysM repeat protein
MSPFNRKIELSPRLKLSVGRGLSQNRKLKIFASGLLVLAIALSLNALRLIFFSSSPASERSNAGQEQVLGASDVQNPEEEVNFTEYTVQKNDTLFSISQKFNISWTTLATLNNLKSPFLVKPGQTLKVPK